MVPLRQRWTWTGLAITLAGLSIVWVAIVFLVGLEPVGLPGPPFLIVGVATVTVGLMRLRNPRWQDEGWWADHPMIAFVVGGPALTHRRGSRGHEGFSGAMQMLVGLALVVGGALVMLPA